MEKKGRKLTTTIFLKQGVFGVHNTHTSVGGYIHTGYLSIEMERYMRSVYSTDKNPF